MTVSEAVSSGNRLEVLRALRTRLAAEIDSCDSSKDLPALVLRLTDVLAQLDAAPSDEEVSAADEIAKRRAARRSGGAADSSRSTRSV